MKNRLFIVFDQQLYFYITSHKLLSIKNWRDRLGIEPSKPGTQVSDGFEDRGGHQNPIQPRNDNYDYTTKIFVKQCRKS